MISRGLLERYEQPSASACALLQVAARMLSGLDWTAGFGSYVVACSGPPKR